MSASSSDKITDTRNAARPVSTTVSSPRTTGGTTLTCGSLTGWPTASKIHGVTYQIDSNSNPVAGTQLDFSGIVSGSVITQFTVIDGSDTGNSVGDVVEMLPTSAWGQDLADGLTNEHHRDGSHSDVTADTITTGTLAVSTGTTLPAGDIGTADIADDAITTVKIADNNVTPDKMLGIDLFGRTGALTGSAPSAGTGQFYIQTGSTVSTGGAQEHAIVFPTPFPNGVISVVASQGDFTITGGGPIAVRSVSASQFSVIYPSGGTVRTNWIAIGF